MYSHIVAGCVVVASASLARADIANFDSMQEGHFNTVIVDGGIQFSNLDRRLEGQVVPAPFVIEDAANMLHSQDGFTWRNALGFGVYSPGEPVTFSRLGSFDITPARPASRIVLHVYDYGEFSGRSIDLALTRNGQVVGSMSVPAVGPEGLHHYVLDYDGPTFDMAHVSIGPDPTSYIFALLDSVTIDDAIPCPADWDGSGMVDSSDFFAFLESFFGEDADFNDDGMTDSRDLFDFILRLFIGC